MAELKDQLLAEVAVAGFARIRERAWAMSDDWGTSFEYRSNPRAFSPERCTPAHTAMRELCPVCLRTIGRGAPVFLDGTSGLSAHPGCFGKARKRALRWYIGLTRRPEPAFELSRAVLVEALGITGCALNHCDWAVAPGQIVWRDLDNGRVCCQQCAARARLAAARKGRR